MNKTKGFTLVEILIVVAIIGILAGIAFPSYQGSILKSKRAEAKEALLSAAGRQEREYLQSNAYIVDSANNDFAQISPLITESGTYSIDVASCDGNSTSCFVLTATARGSQSDDTKCQTFTLDNVGEKLSTNSAGTLVDDCW